MTNPSTIVATHFKDDQVAPIHCCALQAMSLTKPTSFIDVQRSLVIFLHQRNDVRQAELNEGVFEDRPDECSIDH